MIGQYAFAGAALLGISVALQRVHRSLMSGDDRRWATEDRHTPMFRFTRMGVLLLQLEVVICFVLGTGSLAAGLLGTPLGVAISIPFLIVGFVLIVAWLAQLARGTDHLEPEWLERENPRGHPTSSPFWSAIARVAPRVPRGAVIVTVVAVATVAVQFLATTFSH